MFAVLARAGKAFLAGSATSSRWAATRRSLATKIGDCHPLEGLVTVGDGPEGNVRGIWHQPQGRRRSQRSEPAGSLLFLWITRSLRCQDGLKAALIQIQLRGDHGGGRIDVRQRSV
jgi:hypothetical protein